MSLESKTTIEEHQRALFVLLQAFDEVCRKHDIHYMLFAGTALGAVRHKDFIPWDDDLDVVMLRPEYERFLAVAPREIDNEKFYLQIEHSDHWPMFFSKLRMNNTTCLERFVPKDPLIHQGVFMDIFPCDNLSDNPLVRKLQFYASKVVISKSLERRGYLTDSALKKAFMLLCRCLPMAPFKRFVLQRGRGDTAYVHTFFGGAVRYEKNIYPRQWFQKEILMPFHGGEYPVSAQYDELLTNVYGDYMTPQPEKDRGCKVHAEFIDLEHPYTEYLEQQKSMTFKEYSRSIR